MGKVVLTKDNAAEVLKGYGFKYSATEDGKEGQAEGHGQRIGLRWNTKDRLAGRSPAWESLRAASPEFARDYPKGESTPSQATGKGKNTGDVAFWVDHNEAELDAAVEAIGLARVARVERKQKALTDAYLAAREALKAEHLPIPD